MGAVALGAGPDWSLVRRVTGGVVQEDGQGLQDAPAIGHDPRQDELQASMATGAGDAGSDLVHQGGHRLRVDRESAGLDAGCVEQITAEESHPVRLLTDQCARTDAARLVSDASPPAVSGLAASARRTRPRHPLHGSARHLAGPTSPPAGTAGSISSVRSVSVAHNSSSSELSRSAISRSSDHRMVNFPKNCCAATSLGPSSVNRRRAVRLSGFEALIVASRVTSPTGR